MNKVKENGISLLEENGTTPLDKLIETQLYTASRCPCLEVYWASAEHVHIIKHFDVIIYA